VQNLFAVLRLKIACRRSGVTRVKLEEEGGKKEIVLALHKGVTAKEIVKLVSRFPKWRISGSNVRVAYEDVAGAGDGVWIDKLTEQVAVLRKGKGSPA